jgi:peptidoglycan/LPS O-acetylase OafA/YrhL
MLINVQFLRFAAAMLVALYHSSAHLRSVGIDQGPLFAVSEAVGFAGVDVFFVISGFIMAWTTRAASGPRDALQFFRRRVARIYSGYWPFFLLAIALFAWTNPEFLERSDLGRSAVLWPTNRLILAVSWTLIFELYFYCCYTILIAFSRGRHTTVLIAAFFIVGLWSLYSHYVREAYAPGNLEYMSAAEYYMASPYLAEFIAGALLAVWLLHKPEGVGWPWVLGGVLLFLAGGWINNQYFDGNIEQGYWVLYRVGVFGLPSLMILLGLVRIENANRSAPVRFSLLAGGASYAVYLSHTLILTFTQSLGFNQWAATFPAAAAQAIFVGLAATILAFSIVHYRWVERPLHKLFLRLLGVYRKPATG